MRRASCLLVLGTGLLAGCTGLLAGCTAAPPDPIRVVDSPADVALCRSLGSVGGPVRTSGERLAISGLPANTTLIPVPSIGYGPAGGGDNFALHLDAFRAATLERGGSHLLLVRRHLRDWSYVEGVAYRCGSGRVSDPIRARG